MTTLGKGKLGTSETVWKWRQTSTGRARPQALSAQTHKLKTCDCHRDRRTKVFIRMAATQIFDPALAVLRPEAMPVLDAIMSELGPLGKPIRVSRPHRQQQNPLQGHQK